MRAAVTEGVEAMGVVERPDPAEPGPGEVVVTPEAVGICGSDYHFYLGELSPEAGGSQFPRVQGHEIGATIAAVGPGCAEDLVVGQRVAVWPLRACGACYPCSVGRPNTCDNFSLIGIHADGGLQDLLSVPAEQVFPIRADDPAVAALAEPVSIAVRAVNRAGVIPGERVVVLGAGPIGQCIGLVARERGADVLVVDLMDTRLALSRDMGADTLVWTDRDEVVLAARDWAGPAGPPAAFDATGAPAAVRAMIDMVASAGRAVQVGMSGEEVTFRLGSLTEKELDLLGVSCCGAEEFGEAVAVVERNAPLLAPLISHRFALDQAPEAMRFAIENPTDVMKVVIGDEV
ncbi:MAG TPA: alcohol dehydrogenase catalytic domain-containing protein [Solirubrobacteraceae bacterium]|jgi:L-gulonate 5-dehydrogenase|nr:alcohol dehydrogenase catalytic domain-containing protein [Solirubrobacteraceae bacterium]